MKKKSLRQTPTQAEPVLTEPFAGDTELPELRWPLHPYEETEPDLSEKSLVLNRLLKLGDAATRASQKIRCEVATLAENFPKATSPEQKAANSRKLHEKKQLSAELEVQEVLWHRAVGYLIEDKYLSALRSVLDMFGPPTIENVLLGVTSHAGVRRANEEKRRGTNEKMRGIGPQFELHMKQHGESARQAAKTLTALLKKEGRSIPPETLRRYYRDYKNQNSAGED